VSLPKAFDADDNEWWIEGHHDDVTALDAVRRAYGDRAIVEFPWPSHTTDYFTITRGWWRDAHDGEAWKPCRMTDPGAKAFTRLKL
jgi:hypothetical protein